MTFLYSEGRVGGVDESFVIKYPRVPSFNILNVCEAFFTSKCLMPGLNSYVAL